MQFDTTQLSKSLGIESIGIIDLNLEDDQKWNCENEISNKRKSNQSAFYWNNLSKNERKERLKNHGMTGKKHSQETKMKMSKSALGRKNKSLHKGGVLEKDGVIVEFSCIAHFCQENNLSCGHICELLNGKRKSVKGWRKYNG